VRTGVELMIRVRILYWNSWIYISRCNVDRSWHICGEKWRKL